MPVPGGAIPTYCKPRGVIFDCSIVAGGTADGTRGSFVEPTILLTRDPRSRYMQEEFFGPIVSVYVFPDADFAEVLVTIDETKRIRAHGSDIRDRSGRYYPCHGRTAQFGR
jgi:hypothetical protein